MIVPCARCGLWFENRAGHECSRPPIVKVRRPGCDHCGIDVDARAFVCAHCGAFVCSTLCLAGHADERATRGMPACLLALLGREEETA